MFRPNPLRRFPISNSIRRLSSSSTSNAKTSTHKNILIVNKLRTKPVADAIDALLAHIRDYYPGTTVFHENRPDIPNGALPWVRSTATAAAAANNSNNNDNSNDNDNNNSSSSSSSNDDSDRPPIDLVITLGGDGTILHAASLFKKRAVPPVLSFSMGTLGFLLPFHIDDYAPALKAAFTGNVTTLFRMRLTVTFQDALGRSSSSSSLSPSPPLSPTSSPTSPPPTSPPTPDGWQVMNEVALHRGRSPHLTTIDAYVDGQHLTESVSDGLIVSTPTGSTAYSLSAGGPIVHPSLSAIVLTPICPRSLSFRPLVFPGTSSLTLRIGDRSRAPAGVSLDGQEARLLAPGDSVTVRASPYAIPCINRSSISEPAYDRKEEGAGPGKEDDWVRDINNLLQYNATFRSKALARHAR